jgi:hypothetical protein
MVSRVVCCDEAREIFRSKKNNTIAGVVWTLLLPVSEMCSTKNPVYQYIHSDHDVNCNYMQDALLKSSCIYLFTYTSTLNNTIIYIIYYYKILRIFSKITLRNGDF